MAYLDYDGLKYFKGKLDGEIFANSIIETAEGAIASFDDGSDGLPVRKLEVAVTPSQDLHGYDNPWPAGGGKNICDVIVSNDWDTGSVSDGVFTSNALTATGNVNGARLVFNHTFDLAANTEYFFSFDAKLVSGTLTSINSARLVTGSSTTISGTNVTMPSLTSSYQRCVCKSTPEENTTVGKIFIQLNTPTNAVIMITNVMVSTSSDSTFAPYSNICPISGWTGANVTRVGKNLANPELLKSGYTDLSERQYHNSDNAKTQFIETAGLTTVKVSGTGLNRCNVCYYNHIPADAEYADTAVTSYVDSYVIPVNTNYKYVAIQVAYGASVSDIQVEVGSTATDYEEYQAQTIEVTFPAAAGTVYGGTLTKNSDGTGTLVVDKVKKSGTGNFYVGGGPRPSGLYYYDVNISGVTTSANVICNKLQTKGGDAAWNSDVPCIASGNAKIRVYTPESTLAAFQTAYADLFIVYDAPTPVSYTLTAEELGDVLTTLYGTNNVWADAGGVEVTYTADPKIYIDNSLVQDTVSQFIAPVENGATASQAYAQGKYFLRNNKFCKAKTSIASGATFTLNTNYEETTIGAELYTALNS